MAPSRSIEPGPNPFQTAECTIIAERPALTKFKTDRAARSPSTVKQTRVNHRPLKLTGEPKKRPSAPAKPLTTAGKIARAAANNRKMKTPMPPPQSSKTGERKAPLAPLRPVAKKGIGAVDRLKERKAAEEKAKEPKKKYASMMTSLRSQGSTSTPVKIKGPQPIFLRRTARSEKYFRAKLRAWQQSTAGQKKNTEFPGTDAEINVAFKKKMKAFAFLDLPEELRLMVYSLVVIDDEFFIWPDSPTGAEQPDISMVCRQLRKEVLPVFYGGNTFAIDIGPQKTYATPNKKAKQKLSPIGALEKWAKVIGKTGSFSMIKSWAFSYVPLDALSSFSRSDDGSITVLVSIVFIGKDKERTAQVQVHRDATCIMTGHAECGNCEVQCSPAWLNDDVIRILDGSEEGGGKPAAVVHFAGELRMKAAELKVYRCRVGVISLVGMPGMAVEA